MRLILLKIFIFGFVIAASSQVGQKGFCYQEDSLADNEVFQKMELPPEYYGGIDKLNQFILQNINVDKISSSLARGTRLLSDTLQLQFIISKQKKMSRLSVTGTQNNAIKEELLRVFILSSCNWVPGAFSGRRMNGWFKEQMIFTLDRRGKYLSLKVEW
jgi:hypothetical protein